MPPPRSRSVVARPSELKFFDTLINFTADNTPEIPATGQLTLIPQGTTDSQRIGRKCVIKSIGIKGTATLVPGAAATASDVIWIYVMLDRQCNGAAADVATANTGIFTLVGGNNLNSAQLNLAQSGRFLILKKFVLEFNPGAGVTTAYNNCAHSFDFWRRVEIPIEYDSSATTGALTTIRSNNIFLVAGTSGGADDLVSVTGSCRLRFADN